MFEMPTRNDVFFLPVSRKKVINFGGHLKQISSLLVPLGLFKAEFHLFLFH
jgi:hypothetical protein